MQKITSEQLVNGVLKYFNHEVIPKIGDTFTKLLIRTITINAESNLPTYVKFVEDFIQKPLISDLINPEEGAFEIEKLIDSVRQAVNEVGELEIKIPPVKFLSPEEKTLSFGASDISKLKQFLTNEIK